MAQPDDVVVEIDGKRYFKRDAVVGNTTDLDALNKLQALADAGHIKLTRYWCSERGYLDNAEGGHFHSQGAVHLPVAFEMATDPGEGWETLWHEPYTFHIPLNKDGADATE